MNNNLLLLKVTNRLNKLSSYDYDDIEKWQVAEAFNKFQNEWVRSKIAEGERDNQVSDDIQALLKEIPLDGNNTEHYFEAKFPKDYFGRKRLSVLAGNKECNESTSMIVYSAEVANVDSLLKDANKKPSFEWRETFKTEQGNTIRVYTDGFRISKVFLTYFRTPSPISFEGGVDEYDKPTRNSECELKDDVAEILIKGACEIIAGDIESFNQVQRLANTK